MIKSDEGLTPLMRQYNLIKAKYPDAILLFRVGDFYETFNEDAIESSKILNITLTKRANSPLAGFPYHSIDTYLPKLVKAGKRCAICEQLEDPKLVKGIVKRGVTEVVTPALSYNEKTTEERENNFLAAIHYDKDNLGVSFLDIGTGEFVISEGKKQDMEKLIESFSPKEVLVQKQRLRLFEETFSEQYYTNCFEDWVFNLDFAYEVLQKHFGVNSLKGFGVENMPLGIIASGAIFHYLNETKHTLVSHIQKISPVNNSNYLWLDRFTIANLELISSPNNQKATLFNILNKTQSNMGARLLQRWIVLPLINKQEIEKRHSIVRTFIEKEDLSYHLAGNIRRIGDLERMIAKAAYGRIQPNEVVQLKNILKEIEQIKHNCSDFPALERVKMLDSCSSLMDIIDLTLKEDSPNNVSKGDFVKKGYDQELDSIREISINAKQYLLKLQQKEAENTNIPSLKISYNNVFGYYLEVTNTHKDKVPSSWHRKQTLTNSERYITEELKDFETRILSSQSRIEEIENKIYAELLSKIIPYISTLQTNASIISELDCLLGFSFSAIENNYVCPNMNEGFALNIVGGRHPVIERMLKAGETYIANDLYLDNETQQIEIITGPNMSGKSAYLRQNALIVLMAQIGSMVSAKSCDIGIVDRIFTRVGASDNISSGESTFMVEMNETASILNNLSSRSLVLLDEIGRGTSTYDGVSIAWAIAAYLHDEKSKAKVLFATHYHELIEMEQCYQRIKNFHVSVKEVGKDVIFLRKISLGGSSQSFGIHVAKLAGMPKDVLSLAEEILENLEKKQTNNKGKLIAKNKEKNLTEGFQLSFVQLDDPILIEIKEDILNTDINNLTPMEALVKLNEIKKLIEKV